MENTGFIFCCYQFFSVHFIETFRVHILCFLEANDLVARIRMLLKTGLNARGMSSNWHRSTDHMLQFAVSCNMEENRIVSQIFSSIASSEMSQRFGHC